MSSSDRPRVLKQDSVDPRGEQYRELVDRILGSGVHLMRLVNTILDISEFDAGQLRLNDEFLDVGECVELSVQLIEREAHKAGVRLSVGIEPGLPKLCGDPKRINQILVNLISNGIRFSPPGGEVRVSAFRRGDDGPSLSVADKGIGMSANDIPKALERFGQLDADPNRQHEGAGLGLPLAQHLMELHGGSLRIASEPGVGTIVTVTFPARRIVRERTPIRAERKNLIRLSTLRILASFLNSWFLRDCIRQVVRKNCTVQGCSPISYQLVSLAAQVCSLHFSALGKCSSCLSTLASPRDEDGEGEVPIVRKGTTCDPSLDVDGPLPVPPGHHQRHLVLRYRPIPHGR